jgi:putative FmdB family regulatory protein
MPLYGFRCPKCGLEFDVSRPMSRSGEPAFCLVDNTECERQITMPMTYVKSDPSAATKPPPAQGAGSWSHHGHSHGFGSSSHTHGPGEL